MISYLHDPTSHLKKLVLNTIFSFYWCEEGKYMVRNTRRASTVCPDLSKVVANAILFNHYIIFQLHTTKFQLWATCACRLDVCSGNVKYWNFNFVFSFL